MTKPLRGIAPKAAKIGKPKILVFGRPGVGKSFTALDFPTTYYVDTEGGVALPHYLDKLRKSGGTYMGPNEGSMDFGAVVDEIQTLATTQHQFRTLVIDSFSKLFETKIALTAEAMEKAGKKNEFGADKKPAVSLTRRMMAWLDRIDMNVLLICHEKPVWKDGEQIGVTFAGYDKLEYELHLALNIVKQGPARKARVVKTRLTAFPDAEVFDWSYEAFADRYGREVMEAKAEAVHMATEEQLKRYEALMAVVKVSEDILEKWGENCPKVTELPEADMAKRLEYLGRQLPKAAAS